LASKMEQREGVGTMEVALPIGGLSQDAASVTGLVQGWPQQG